MATIKFYIQSNSSSAPIYARFSHGREVNIKRKTGLSIDPKSWSRNTGFPITRDKDTKSIQAKLKQLELDVLNAFNDSNSKGSKIDGSWLESSIDKSFNRNQEVDLDYLLNYCNDFIVKLTARSERLDSNGVAPSTLKKYETIVKKLKEFQEHKRKEFLLLDVDLDFRDDFISYLLDVDKLSENTTGRYIKFVKTIVLDAQKKGYNISNQIHSFKGFTVQIPIVTLSLEELEQIQKTILKKQEHKIAKDWLVIGFYTGQRVSDLLRMNKDFIKHFEGFDFIILTQKKTKKIVQIPMRNEVKEILKKYNGEFPPLFSLNSQSNDAIFNKHLKQVCKKAGINSLVEGKIFDDELKMNVKGTYEKWKLVSSHICRRSFATHFYGQIATPLLMNITAHSTERMFLNYIGKEPLNHSLELARIWKEELYHIKK